MSLPKDRRASYTSLPRGNDAQVEPLQSPDIEQKSDPSCEQLGGARDLGITMEEWRMQTRKTAQGRVVLWGVLLTAVIGTEAGLIAVAVAYNKTPEDRYTVKPNTILSILSTILSIVVGVLLGSVTMWATWAKAEDSKVGVSLQQVDACGYSGFGLYRGLIFLKMQPSLFAIVHLLAAVAILVVGPLTQAAIRVSVLESTQSTMVTIPLLNETDYDSIIVFAPHSFTGEDVLYTKGFYLSLYGSQPTLFDAGCGPNCTYTVPGLGWDAQCGQFLQSDFVVTQASGGSLSMTIPMTNQTLQYTNGYYGCNAYLSDFYATSGPNNSLVHTTVFMRYPVSQDNQAVVPQGVQGGYCVAQLGAFDYAITGQNYTRSPRQATSDETEVMGNMVNPLISALDQIPSFTDDFSGTADSFQGDITSQALFGMNPVISVPDVEAKVKNAYDYANILMMNSYTGKTQTQAVVRNSVVAYQIHILYVVAAVIISLAPVTVCSFYAFPTPKRIQYIGSTLTSLVLAGPGPSLQSTNAGAATPSQIDGLPNLYLVWKRVGTDKWHRYLDISPSMTGPDSDTSDLERLKGDYIY